MASTYKQLLIYPRSIPGLLGYTPVRAQGAAAGLPCTISVTKPYDTVSASNSPSTVQRIASMRWRMVMAVVLLSMLLVGLTDALHIAHDEALQRALFSEHLLSIVLRDIVLVALLSLALVLVLDRLLLMPLRHLAASTEAFDPTLPPPLSQLPEAAAQQPAELRQLTHSISRAHHSMWQQLQREQHRALELRAEIERQQDALQHPCTLR
eukprot:Opistho-1_new@48901